MAKYKPGQLITINHKVYRVKDGSDIGWCDNCDLNEDRHDCEDCRTTFPNCTDKIGSYCYLELVVSKKPKNKNI